MNFNFVVVNFAGILFNFTGILFYFNFSVRWIDGGGVQMNFNFDFNFSKRCYDNVIRALLS